MPNKPTHLAVGLMTGAAVALARVYYVAQSDLSTGTSIGPLSLTTITLLSAAVGGQFGLLPDILEPAKKKHWRHRRFFHSYTVLLLLLFFTVQTELNLDLHDLVRHFFTVAAAGYVSHLLLDSRTPAGLPWI